MSEFQITAAQRRRLLEGESSPLDFEIKPHGCEPGAVYVLSWSKAQATIVGEGEVVRIPRRAVWFLTVTAVVRHRKGFWRVQHEVTDLRDRDVFLRPGGGDSSVDVLDAGAKPPSAWLDVRARAISEFDHQRRLARFAEERRERDRARRKRAA